jgi:hypothetical protein
MYARSSSTQRLPKVPYLIYRFSLPYMQRPPLVAQRSKEEVSLGRCAHRKKLPRGCRLESARDYSRDLFEGCEYPRGTCLKGARLA